MFYHLSQIKIAVSYCILYCRPKLIKEKSYTFNNLIMKKIVLAIFIIMICANAVHAQNEYRYSIDLTKIVNDSLNVELLVPKLQKSVLTFSFPKI